MSSIISSSRKEAPGGEPGAPQRQEQPKTSLLPVGEVREGMGAPGLFKGAEKWETADPLACPEAEGPGLRELGLEPVLNPCPVPTPSPPPSVTYLGSPQSPWDPAATHRPHGPLPTIHHPPHTPGLLTASYLPIQSHTSWCVTNHFLIASRKKSISLSFT